MGIARDILPRASRPQSAAWPSLRGTPNASDMRKGRGGRLAHRHGP
ncbi:hypothetical protein BLIJ_0102 [Bifidobacterium longum subsp. infantis ATCC 15697 = JCM 1222 = DSM 20088]|nr:hypothetical protein BLIJ_0102 [Bifidobacterium longum subsp. infantis ATCC 15697 = JCM 1222 = DSM 20088]